MPPSVGERPHWTKHAPPCPTGAVSPPTGVLATASVRLKTGTSIRGVGYGPDCIFQCLFELYELHSNITPLLEKRMRKIAKLVSQGEWISSPSVHSMRALFVAYFKAKHTKYTRSEQFKGMIDQRLEGWVTPARVSTMTTTDKVNRYAKEMGKSTTWAGPVELDIASTLFGVKIHEYFTEPPTGPQSTKLKHYRLLNVYDQNNKRDGEFAYGEIGDLAVAMPPWEIVHDLEKPEHIRYVIPHRYATSTYSPSALLNPMLDWVNGSMKLITLLSQQKGSTWSYAEFSTWFRARVGGVAPSLQTLSVYFFFIFYKYYVNNPEDFPAEAVAAAVPEEVLLGSPSLNFLPLQAPADNGSVVDAVFAKAKRCN